MSSQQETSINLIESFGYVVSGTLTFLIAYWFCINFLQPIPIEVLDENISIGDSIIFIVASYIVGHLVQAIPISERIFILTSKQLKLFFDKNRYDNSFESEVAKAIVTIFKLPPDTQNKNSKTILYEEFDLCHSFVIQKKLIKNDFFMGMFILYRGTKNAIKMGIL